MKNLYKELVKKYVDEFCKRNDLYPEEYETDIFNFADVFLSFDDLRFAVDNNINYSELAEWQEANTFNFPNRFINIQSWHKGLRHKDLGIQQIRIDSKLTTLNEYSNAERSNKRIAAAIKKRETIKCKTYAKASKIKLEDGMYDVVIDWFTSDNRTDPDNIYFAVKFILDGCVNAKVMTGDGRKNIRKIHHNIKTTKKDYCIVIFKKVFA